MTPRWIVFGTAVVYFALGSLLTAHFMQLKEAWADSHRVFQLEINHPVPGKVPPSTLPVSTRASPLLSGTLNTTVVKKDPAGRAGCCGVGRRLAAGP